MRLAGVSQLPVLDGTRVIGLIDESDILLKVQGAPERFSADLSLAMTTALEKLPPDATLEQLRAVLDRGLVAIIASPDRFYGLITRFDLLNHLRRSVS
jgi:cystathionine beta-synthase